MAEPPSTLIGGRPIWFLRLIVALIGFTSTIAQIVLLRELIVVFSGNELSLGLMLGSWVLWTATGSALLGRLGAKTARPGHLVAALQAAVAVGLPVTILGVRVSRLVFQALPGEILGPVPAILTSLGALSLYCLVSGWLFVAASRLWASRVSMPAAEATGTVYLWEAAGACAGGALASLVLLLHFGAFAIAGLLAALNLGAAATLAIRARWPRIATATIVAAAVLLAAPGGSRALEQFSLAYFWRGPRVMATRNSIYGNLVVARTEDTGTVFENGAMLFNVPDLAGAEEAVHFGLLEQPAPRRVLLIGGGVNGSALQVFAHPTVERLDYVEIDPAILELMPLYFASAWAPIEQDHRIHIHAMDGRLFLKTTPDRFDVILINLPDPQTAQLNRFFTSEFYREAARKLTPSGVLSFSVSGSEDYINPQLAAFLRCLKATLRSVFADVAVIPGDPVHFFAARRTGILTRSPGLLMDRIRERRLHTSYVREYFLPFRMAPDRMAEIEAQIQPLARTRINHDFAPIAYYFDVALWSARFDPGHSSLFESLARVRFRTMAGAAGLLIALAAAAGFRLRMKQRRRASAGLSVATIGFSLMGFEMFLILAFQALYGYVYEQLAVVIAGFMAGMALGGWIGILRMKFADMRGLFRLQFLAAAGFPALYFLFCALRGISGPVALFLVSQILFPALALLCGLLGGCQFPIASRVFFAGSPRDGRGVGSMYALDLAGASVGAILFSVWLIPVFGFLETALLASMLNLAPAALFFTGARRTPAP